MNPWIWTILGGFVGLILGLILIYIWKKKRRMNQRLKQERYEQVMKEFEYAENTFAKDKEKKSPQQILWDIAHNRKNIYDDERGFEQEHYEHDTRTGIGFDKKEQGIGITELPQFNQGRDNMENNPIPTSTGTDRTPKTNIRRSESSFQRRLRERREGK